MTVARRGIPSARVCGNNQKRCTPGFYRVNDSRVYPGAMVEETGSCITESATTVSRCDVCNVSQIMAQDVVMWQSGTQDILSE